MDIIYLFWLSERSGKKANESIRKLRGTSIGGSQK